jgi:hypothetical protein
MNRQLELADEELQELDFLVKKEWRSSEIELNHTRAFAYKDVLKQRIQLLEKLSPKLTCFKPVAAQILPEAHSSQDGVRRH